MNRPAQKQSAQQQIDIVNGPSGTAFWGPRGVKGTETAGGGVTRSVGAFIEAKQDVR